jgi:hypothetical protein
MPARSSVMKASHAAPLNRLATNGGEKCGLDPMCEISSRRAGVNKILFIRGLNDIDSLLDVQIVYIYIKVACRGKTSRL